LGALQINLEQKAKGYKNHAQSSIFLLNNYHYIMKNLKAAQLTDFVGVETVLYFDRLCEDSRRSYNETTWNKALNIINEENWKELANKVKGQSELSSSLKKQIKQRFSVCDLVCGGKLTVVFAGLQQDIR
jgi:exocyst complex protein 7